MGCWVFWPSRSSVLWLWRWLYRSSSLSVGSEISCRAAARSSLRFCRFCCFFFQAEDGIRDPLVTGVQTCALPISDGHDLIAVRTAQRAHQEVVLHQRRSDHAAPSAGGLREKRGQFAGNAARPDRSEERRVGKEWRARWEGER